MSAVPGDFDGDGIPDLAIGFSTAGAGLIVIRKGNADLIYPHAEIATRLAGERGHQLTQLAGATVQSVTRGILGVAVIICRAIRSIREWAQ